MMESSFLPSSTSSYSTFVGSTPSTACSFWTAQINFTQPISARHFCLLGNNRYTSPTTYGACNDQNEDNGLICRTCVSWDGSQTRNDCHYLKGQGEYLGMVPPTAGYDDWNCPVGYEKFTDVMSLDIGCPVDSVLALEIFPTTTVAAAAAVSQSDGQQQQQQLAATYHSYDFSITTPPDVTREFEAHRCLTGAGGRDCGEDTLMLLAYHHDGHCQTEFNSGVGYKIKCDNGFDDTYSFWGGTRKQNCQFGNGLSCLQVMQNAAAVSSQTDIQFIDGDDLVDIHFNNGLCGIDQAEYLSSTVAWLAGTGVILLTLVPSFAFWRAGTITPTFLVGLLSEAIKNGAVVASIVSLDWSCLGQYGMIPPSGNHTILLPYALIAFSLADTLLMIIAMFSRRGKDLVESLDKFKWFDTECTLARRITTFLTIVILGGLGGFMQLALILEGTVADSPDESTKLHTGSTWIFVVSAAIGGLIGPFILLYGVYTGNMRMAWKTYKILVGDIPGTVSSIDLAVVLSPGWVFETFNDMLQLLLYLPPILRARTKTGLSRSSSSNESFEQPP